MSVMLICTLGSRDLQLSGELIKPAREKGREIMQNLDTVKGNLTYPIIRNVLEHILNIEKQSISRLVLIPTDQDEQFTKSEYRLNDTIEFARILKKLISEHYGHKVRDVKISPITKNPAYLDTMFSFFNNTLNDAVFQMRDIDKCYVEQTGGVPAANMALLYQCVNKFKDKCHVLYVTESNQVISLRISDIILDEKRKSLFPHLVEKYDYASLCAHLDESRQDEHFMLNLCQYAQRRLHFDTDEAILIADRGINTFFADGREVFEHLASDLQHLASDLQHLASDLQKVKSKDYVSLIAELFYNMRIKYLRQEFVDFLGRIYRFEEGVLRYIIETELDVTTKKEKSSKSLTLARYIEENSELSDLIRSQKTPEGEAVDPSKHGLPRFNACLNYLIVEKGKDEYKKVYEIFRKFVQLINIRNESIIGHGFKGVSEEIIKENYDGDVLEDLKAVVSLVLEKSGRESESDPFERINRILIERISQL